MLLLSVKNIHIEIRGLSKDMNVKLGQSLANGIFLEEFHLFYGLNMRRV